MAERHAGASGPAFQALIALAAGAWPWIVGVPLLVLAAIGLRGEMIVLDHPLALSATLIRARGAVPPLVDDVQARTFRFFWDTAQSDTGLVPDRYPSPSPSNIAGVGFALTAYPIGVERGYVAREAARTRVLRTLRFLHDAPQGTDATGTAGHRGFFYRFLDLQTGRRAGDMELSTVDTALLLGGVLFCQSYFGAAHEDEVEIRRLAEAIYRRVDWRWAQVRPPAISHGWTPEAGFLAYDWRGYNEAMLVYVLALGSPTHPVGRDAWEAWVRGYAAHWDRVDGRSFLAFGPHFGHQYSHVWLDFRDILDRTMRRAGFDYLENSRRATVAQRAYAMANPMGWTGYGPDVWGLTASDGSADARLTFGGKTRQFRSYWARGAGGPHGFDDGTIAPTAAAASIAFAPEIAIPAVLEMHRRYGAAIFGEYGFYDSFNPSFTFDVPLKQGRRVPGGGWVATDYLAIDQGPIVAMIENYRSGLVWRVMRTNPHIRRGLAKAGFTGGWLDQHRGDRRSAT
jgi:hypothetical protein